MIMQHTFKPDNLVAAKTQGHQLTFFDFDRTLLDFAYDATQRILVEKFETAVGAARHFASEREDINTEDLTKAVLQILAAAILEDKLLLGGKKIFDRRRINVPVFATLRSIF